MARDYLTEHTSLVLLVQLVDARHLPTSLDKQLNDWLIVNTREHLVVATKADKLSNNQLQKQLKLITQHLPESPIVPYSSETGRGRDEVWSEIGTALKKS